MQIHKLLLLLITLHSAFIKANQLPVLNPIRRLLCHIRGGDYVHPGDEHVIDLVINQILQFEPNLKGKPVLDVGCGFGGTVNYLAKQGFCDIQGLDLDQAAINYAQSAYPKFNFLAGNALQADQFFKNQSFGLITLFSVIYAIEDKRTLLSALGNLACPGALLAIMDYTRFDSLDDAGLKDANNKSMYAIVPNELRLMLDETGWDLLVEQDLTDYFNQSYAMILNNLAIQEIELNQMFTPEVVQRVREIYTAIKNNIEFGKLGGMVLYARKRSST